MKRYDYALEKDMDAAIAALAGAIQTSGRNEKPVIMHSIRVGIELFDRGYPREVVLAGILHDVLEDSGFSEASLRREFGDEVAELVRTSGAARCL